VIRERLLASEHLHPGNAALGAEGALDRGIEHAT
jgi:hypothetical protein